MNKRVIPILTLALLVIIPIVSAGPLFDYFSYTLSGNDVSSFYYSYQGWIEFFIYLTIFISLIIGVFKERFGKKQTKLIAISMGVALSFALANYKPGLLSDLGPIAFLIFIALFWYFIFASFKEGFEDQWLSMALAYLISIALLWIVDPQQNLKSHLYSLPGIDWLKDIFVILLIIAGIIVIFKVKEKYFDK